MLSRCANHKKNLDSDLFFGILKLAGVPSAVKMGFVGSLKAARFLAKDRALRQNFVSLTPSPVALAARLHFILALQGGGGFNAMGA